LLLREPPDAATTALWFGLFEMDNGRMLYVQGHRHFDRDDDSADWAADEPSWAAEGRYLRVEEIAAAETWQDALEAALRLLAELEPWATWPVELAGVAVGFDDGDPHLVWTAPA
jgi:hypothetical protein